MDNLFFKRVVSFRASETYKQVVEALQLQDLRSWAVLQNAFLSSPYDDFKSFLENHRNSFVDFEVNVLVDLLLEQGV